MRYTKNKENAQPIAAEAAAAAAAAPAKRKSGKVAQVGICYVYLLWQLAVAQYCMNTQRPPSKVTGCAGRAGGKSEAAAEQ